MADKQIKVGDTVGVLVNGRVVGVSEDGKDVSVAVAGCTVAATAEDLQDGVVDAEIRAGNPALDQHFKRGEHAEKGGE